MDHEAFERGVAEPRDRAMKDQHRLHERPEADVEAKPEVRRWLSLHAFCNGTSRYPTFELAEEDRRDVLYRSQLAKKGQAQKADERLAELRRAKIRRRADGTYRLIGWFGGMKRA